jgi:superfamily II DNA or RNA helicase
MHPIDSFIVDCPSFEDFRQRMAPLSNKEKGDIAERLAQVYLKTAPEYRTALEEVWLLRDAPASVLAETGLPRDDKGIDLIALHRNGTYWVIQAKYRTDEEEALGWRELSTSFGLASPPRRNISLLVVIHTTARPISNRDLMGTKLVEIGLDRWRQADWSLIRRTIRENVPARPNPSTPTGRFDWQQTVIDEAVKHFRANARGRAQLPCGTGKSLIAYFIANAMEARTMIVAVPSLNLIKQTVRVWLREEVARGRLPDWLCVASDDSVGNVDEIADDRPDLGLPTTTDENKIADWLRRSGERKVVFTTYQSSVKLAAAAEIAGAAFDLVVLDEAHRTAGARHRDFATLLHHHKLKASHRLFMTATERVVRVNGGDDGVVFSMNENVEDYGARFYTMSFKEAIERRIITDYRIVTYFVKESEESKVEELIKHNRLLNLDEGLDPVAARDVATAVATKRVMEQYCVKHPLVFHQKIDASKVFRDQLDLLNGFEIGPVSKNFHVDSASFSAGEREERLDQFIQSPVAVMSNARCLTEGVDVPGIDAVVFATPKQSTVDIVQASGRALRRAEGKELGFIVIPTIVPDDMPFDAFAETTQFKTIIKILAALSTQDDRIVETLRARFYGTTPKGGGKGHERIIEIGGQVPVGFQIPLDEFAFYIETRLWDRVRSGEWRDYDDVVNIVREAGIRSQTQFHSWDRPDGVPSNPHVIYEGKGWTNWGDLFGTDNHHDIEYWTYMDTCAYVQRLGFKSVGDFNRWSRAKKRPKGIPSAPDQIYAGKGWTGWSDFLGTDTFRGEMAPWEEFRAHIQLLGFKSVSELRVWMKSGQKPKNFPSNPNKAYPGKGWTNWADLIGNGHQRSSHWSFDEVCAYIRSFKFKSKDDFYVWAKSKSRPPGIPTNPQRNYAGKGWKGWGHFLRGEE